MTAVFSRRRALQLLSMSLGGGLLLACEADTETMMNDDTQAAKSQAIGSVTAGIRPVENELIAGQAAEIVFYLNNGTDAAIEVLPWATPLEKDISADLFAVTKDSERLPYVGRMVKRAAPTADDYIILEAGEKRETVLNLSRAYDLREAGSYRIELESLALQDQKGLVDVVVVDGVVLVSRL